MKIEGKTEEQLTKFNCQAVRQSFKVPRSLLSVPTFPLSRSRSHAPSGRVVIARTSAVYWMESGMESGMERRIKAKSDYLDQTSFPMYKLVIVID